MKRIAIISLLILSNHHLIAQILNPVHWSYAAKKIGKTEAVLLIRANISDNWHIYSINQKDGGPVKTSFDFVPSKGYQQDGFVTEPKPVSKYDKIFDMEVKYFEKVVVFRQKVMLTSSDAVVCGRVSFMTCNDQKCLAPDEVVFSIPIK